MDVDNSDLSWLSIHLAHGITTHKSFYRQHDATLELQIATCNREWQSWKVKGKKLQDIDLGWVAMLN